METTCKCIYSYYKTLLNIWALWNDGILYGDFPEGSKSLTGALGIDTSDGRSRAKEMFRIGLLKQELTKGTSGLDFISKGNNIQSDLGYISAIISKAANINRTDNIDKSLSALCAIYSIIQSIKIDNIEISINSLIQKFDEVYPCPDGIDFRKWHRYILSAFFCETKYREDLHKGNKGKEEDDSKLFLNFILGQGTCPSMTIRSNVKNGYLSRKVINCAKDVYDAINERISLTDIIQQKSPLFIFGDEQDYEPKGFYGMAIKYNKKFLQLCYEIEKNNIQNSPFLPLYDEDSLNSAKGCVLNELVKVFEIQREEIKIEFKKIMKSIYDGAIDALGILNYHNHKLGTPQNAETYSFVSPYRPYITAIKSKPFLLLAGISGTGKSRIVRELAFATCPKELRDKDGTTPGNYCMIEVKPNWHDSTELLGFYSNLSGKYMFKKFTNFLVKAIQHKDVPFFVCLDEMNLAPVEQYFAEFLSVLETRKNTGDGIVSGALVEAKYFAPLQALYDGTEDDKTKKAIELANVIGLSVSETEIARQLVEKGLTLPENLIVIGTVNMDDTTHQFSRKVIDRAMTIEMNGGNLMDMFGGAEKLEYRDDPILFADFKADYVTADEALEYSVLKDCVVENIKKKLVDKLDEINQCLANTPFQVSYRVLNELVVYLAVLADSEGITDIDNLIAKAIDDITLMKILPRIEGDDEMFKLPEGDKYENRLMWLRAVLPSFTKTLEIKTEDETEKPVIEAETVNGRSQDKLDEMNERLKALNFTRFWP